MATYKVKAPDGQILTIQGPEGVDQAVIVQKARELYARSQTMPAEDKGIPIQPRKAGGPMDSAAKRPEVGSGLIEYNEEEEAAIKAAAGGDAQKEHFLRLIPTIEWRANADRMRSKQLSPKGAAGAYQFMPGTAKLFGVRNRFDFNDSAMGAARYYDEINKRYNGNMAAMLADYNGGPTQAKKVLAGEQPVAETAEYIQLADKYGKNRFVQDTSRRVVSAGPTEHQAPPEEVPIIPYRQATGPMERRGEVAANAAEAALTIGTGLFGTVAGGFAGLAALGLGKGNDTATEWVKNTTDALTWSPKLEGTKALFEAVSPALEYLDTKVKDGAMFASGGNPALATALETGGNALFMLIGPGAIKSGIVSGLAAGKVAAATGGRAAGLKAGAAAGAKALGRESMPYKVHTSEVARKTQERHIAQVAKELQDTAKSVGIELRIDQIHKSVRQVAEGRASDQRGLGFKMISEKLNAEFVKQRTAANDLWHKFRTNKHFADVSWAPSMVKPLAEELVNEGLDIGSKLVKDSLDDIRLLNKRILTSVNKDGTGHRTLEGTNFTISRQSLNELQAIRKRIWTRRHDAKGTSEGTALGIIGKRFDEMLDQQFRADAAKGIDAPWKEWNDARQGWADFKDRWNEFKEIKAILEDPEMTPQKLANSLIGSSSMLGGSKQSSRLYDSIMQLTGNDPGIKIAVEGSVMYDLMKQLIDDPEPTPGKFGMVANNIRKFRKENPELITSMGLDDKVLRAIQHGARAAQHTRTALPVGFVDTIMQGITRHLVGHEIAQAGFRVRLAEKILNHITKRDATSHKEMLKEFAGIDQTPLTSQIAKDEFTKAIIRGELANQYQNFGEWGDTY